METHNVELYTLGRGILYIGEWVGITPPATYNDIGNCPRFDLEAYSEDLEHKQSRGGARSTDKAVTLEKGYRLNFDVDEIGDRNLSYYLMGEKVGDVIRALTQTNREFSLKYKQDNEEGPNRIYYFHKAKIKPAGPMSQITDEWQLMTMEANGLADVTNNPLSPYFDVHRTTTTTTTAP